jgi:penicillin-binding protein 1A
VSLDPKSGGVLAMVGGFDFALSQYNHALQAARQPGSGFKPFVYAAALDRGLSPASIFMDAPLVFADRNLESDYRPDNDDSRYNGPTRLREALYRSINLVTMRVLLDVGAGNVVNFVERFGFDTSTFPRNTQLAVGGGTMAVTPMQMAVAYATFANGGFLVEPHVIDEVFDIDGNRIFKADHPVACDSCAAVPEANGAAVTAAGEPASLEEVLVDGDRQDPSPRAAERVLDERVAYVMHSMLQDVVRLGTARRARSLERTDLAGKTGTTNEAADTWFTGYTPDVVTTVWVGFPDHQPLGAREYASTNPLPIWIDFMQVALAGRRNNIPAQPPGVVTMRINPATGEAARAGDTNAMFEFFLAEHAPRPPRNPGVEQRQPDIGEIKPVEIF